MIFNQAQPDFPPDFIFGSQDQDFVPNIDEIKVHEMLANIFFSKIFYNGVATLATHLYKHHQYVIF